MIRSKVLLALLGTLTGIPAVSTLAGLAFMFGGSLLRRHPGEANALADALIVLLLPMVVLWAALLIFYLVHLTVTDAVPRDKKALWFAVLVFTHSFAMPVYWFHYLWRAPSWTGAGPRQAHKVSRRAPR